MSIFTEGLEEENFLLHRQLAAQDAEIAALKDKLSWYQSGDIHTCHDQCERPMCVMGRENESLKAFKAEIMEVTKAAISEKCDANEVHCSCVPLLRAKLAKEDVEHTLAEHEMMKEIESWKRIAARLADQLRAWMHLFKEDVDINDTEALAAYSDLLKGEPRE